MMIESFRQTGYKREAVELTAETLVAAQYGTVWEGAQITRDKPQNERRPDRATFRPLQPVGGAVFGKFTGAFEPRPSGTDATPPDWFQLCTASGAGLVGDVLTWGSDAMAVNGVIGDTVTIKVRDGEYEKTLAGARVSKLRFFAEKGATWSCECEATGRYSRAVQGSFIASANPTAGLGHPFLGMAVTVGGSTAPVSSAEISIENEVTPTADGTHASGYGQNVITSQKLMCRVVMMHDGVIDWEDKADNNVAGDIVAVSLPVSSGTAGNVLTFTGSMALTSDPTTTYVDGIGYVSLEGEFTSELVLTQS